MAVVTYGDYLQFIGETKLDNEVQVKAALAAAEDYANRFCNRTFAVYDSDDEAATTVTEAWSGEGTRKYFTKEAPIQSDTTTPVINYWDASTEGWVEFGDTYTVNATDDRVTFREGQVFQKGDDNLQIVYVYGFTAVPKTLVRAICLIAQSYQGTEQRDSNVKKETDGEQSWEYFASAKTGEPDDALTLLQPFVRYPND